MQILMLGCIASAMLLTTPAFGVCRSVAQSSELLFIASFEEQDIPGSFGEFSVTLDSAPGEGQVSELEVRVNVTSSDMDDNDINEAIAGPEWFDFASWPQAIFRSTDVQPASPGARADAWLARGELELKGVRRTITVPFRWSDNETLATMTGSVVLSRSDFDIGSGEWAEDDSIGKAVKVRFRVDMDCNASD